ncbi:DUF4340 domain-containing protein [Ructibacterium gallinarum]|uniref:DUF4340 domain-containing protein n=1 Tax=Ructibacterium gallinarum TaxID=2779355 RepID=A0A9D5R9G6_9FIRM|nr:DUF4340 domain-containing protein [Ructibacterium gallinarum]MBE5041065.1 DUF4340 domain-containing protein [Ructibacterium gallinarum]
MTAKGKLIRNSVIAVAALGILAGGYYFAVKWQPAEETSDTTASTSSSIELLNAKTDEVRSVKIQNLDQTYTLLQDDEGNVSIPEIPDIEFEQMSLKSALSGFSSISAEKEITTDMQRVAEFGLNRRDVSFTVTLKDGTVRQFIVGDSLPGETTYYFMEDGGSSVYTLPSYKASSLFKSTNEYRNTNLLSLEGATISHFSVSHGSEKLLAIRPVEEGENPQNTFGASWILETPCPGEGASEDRIGKLIENFQSISILEFVDDHPADLNTYGLGSDAYTVSFTTEEGSYTLRLGKAAEDGVYMQWNDGISVYLGDAAYLSAVSGMDPMLYVEKFVHIANIEDMAAVTITKDGNTYTMEIGDGEEEENPDKYKINGAVTKADDFKKIYQQVIGIMFVEQGNFVVQGEPFMTVTYQFKDGHSDTMKYYEYDERYYVAERSTGTRLTVLKTTLNELFGTLSAAAGTSSAE